uniref:Protein phosphatase 1, regulatory subunit 35 n=1 Tax=Nothobranchius kuhntae TaxID=321403 RepID=A0A1A8JJT3_NOTKU
MSCSTLHSPPPSPHPVPLPISSSSVTSCPELDLSVTLSPTPMIDDTQQKLRTLKQSVLNEQSQMNRCQSGPAGNKRSTKEMSEDPVIITGTAEPQKPLPLQPVLRPHRHLVEPSSALSNQHPSCLERAGLNTTLALKANLQSLQVRSDHLTQSDLMCLLLVWSSGDYLHSFMLFVVFGNGFSLEATIKVTFSVCG